MGLSKETKRSFYTEISPCLIAGEKGCNLKLIGLLGGKINGRYLHGDENEKGFKVKQRTDPSYQRPNSYNRHQFHMICLPLSSIIWVILYLTG